MFDTGFSGWLAINSQDLEGVGWSYLDQEIMKTAQGDAEFNLYLGRISIEEQKFDIIVHAGVDLPEILLVVNG